MRGNSIIINKEMLSNTNADKVLRHPRQEGAQKIKCLSTRVAIRLGPVPLKVCRVSGQAHIFNTHVLLLPLSANLPDFIDALSVMSDFTQAHL